jgi:hypothetical protein
MSRRVHWVGNKHGYIGFEADFWYSVLLSISKFVHVVTKRIPPPPRQNVFLSEERYSRHFRENKSILHFLTHVNLLF